MSSADFVLNSALYFSSFNDLFRRVFVDGSGSGSGGGFCCGATVIALIFILIWHFFPSRKFPLFNLASSPSSSSSTTSAAPVTSDVNSQSRVSGHVSDEDLKGLIRNLEETSEEEETWENVINKSNARVLYSAKCCKPKEGGPLKYISVTVFEDCSVEALRDFYMDNEYRRQWDKTVVGHDQLEVDTTSGIEIGRTIKKFPLLTPREYVLSWRLWEGNDDSFYCFTKECDHSMVPRQRKYVRVGYFRSGWRIRKVPGRNACEIKMFHQEDAGLNVEMAKLAFSRGIWSYVCKMDNALRKYMTMSYRPPVPSLSAVSLITKIESRVETQREERRCEGEREPEGGKGKKVKRRASKKMIANGLILVGGAICLCRGHSALGAKVALAYFLTKLSKKNGASSSPPSPSI